MPYLPCRVRICREETTWPPAKAGGHREGHESRRPWLEHRSTATATSPQATSRGPPSPRKPKTPPLALFDTGADSLSAPKRKTAPAVRSMIAPDQYGGATYAPPVQPTASPYAMATPSNAHRSRQRLTALAKWLPDVRAACGIRAG